MRANQNLNPTIRDPSVQKEIREHALLINLMMDGRLTGANNATNAPPAGGAYAQGDFVRNSQPVELGSAGSRYVVLGWVSTTGGTPGTFHEVRCLTGN